MFKDCLVGKKIVIERSHISVVIIKKVCQNISAINVASKVTSFKGYNVIITIQRWEWEQLPYVQMLLGNLRTKAAEVSIKIICFFFFKAQNKLHFGDVKLL